MGTTDGTRRLLHGYGKYTRGLPDAMMDVAHARTCRITSVIDVHGHPQRQAKRTRWNQRENLMKSPVGQLRHRLHLPLEHPTNSSHDVHL